MKGIYMASNQQINISVRLDTKDRGRFCVLAVKGTQLHIVINKEIMKIGKQFCALVDAPRQKAAFFLSFNRLWVLYFGNDSAIWDSCVPACGIWLILMLGYSDNCCFCRMKKWEFHGRKCPFLHVMIMETRNKRDVLVSKEVI